MPDRNRRNFRFAKKQSVIAVFAPLSTIKGLLAGFQQNIILKTTV
jgi:hypothetical protein